jgi:HK97 family phage major capsid protein
VTISNPTKLSDFSGFLSREQSQSIFERASRSSVVQSLAQEIPLGGNGKSIPVVTGKLSAGWVAEGAKKPASEGALSLKNMDPKKIATIAVVSAEVVRANPGNYMELIRTQVGDAFASAFDAAALHGTSTPFSTHIAQSNKTVTMGTTAQSAGGAFGDINAGLSQLVNDGKRLTGFALDDRFEPVLNGATDTSGRPIFIDSPLVDNAGPIRAGRLLGRSSYIGEGVYDATSQVQAFGGDWTQAAWGVVGGISYKVSTEASVTINGSLVSLFENNLVAVLAEAEYGFLVNDVNAFVKYTNATQVEPVLTSATPNTGGAGDDIVLAGTGFTGATQVKFGAANAASFVIDSDIQITAKVPAGANGSAAVRVIKGLLDSDAVAFTRTGA